jgi:hypothetical protein
VYFMLVDQSAGLTHFNLGRFAPLRTQAIAQSQTSFRSVSREGFRQEERAAKKHPAGMGVPAGLNFCCVWVF